MGPSVYLYAFLGSQQLSLPPTLVTMSLMNTLVLALQVVPLSPRWQVKGIHTNDPSTRKDKSFPSPKLIHFVGLCLHRKSPILLKFTLSSETGEKPVHSSIHFIKIVRFLVRTYK